MSLTSKQIDELRAYAADRKGELAKLITDAADTIEMLSAKLHASQMERSSQYYHGGWIPVSERLPEENQICIVTDETRRNAYEYRFCRQTYDEEQGWTYLKHRIIAWMPLPESYREEGEN